MQNRIIVNRQVYSIPSNLKNVDAGLLMRPEHSETKAKPETRECETETKNLL